jgi:hypothetical protein
MQDFWMKEAKFEQIYYFTDDSLETVLDGGVSIPTQPTFANLKQFLEVRFSTPFLRPEDTLWFFFSGHGLHYANRDYLIPSDGIPEVADRTGIEVDGLVDCLRRSGTNNIVLILDACHTNDQKFGQGFGTDPEGAITLFASNFDQISHEVDELNHGLFTYVLLEGFQLLGGYKTATLEHLYLYLSDRLPKINRHFQKPIQIPRIHVDSSLSLDSISIPQIIRKRSLFHLPLSRGKVHSTIRQSATPLISNTKPLFNPSLILGLATFVILGTGLASYAIYSKWLQNPVASFKNNKELKNNQETGNTKQSPQASKPTRPTPETSISSSLGNQANKSDSSSIPFDSSNLHIAPKTGKYYSTDPLFSTSRREIDRDGDRICIKIIDGSAGSAISDQPQVTVSSLSYRKDGVYIDATDEKLRLDPVYADITDNKGVWQRLETKANASPLMSDCLQSRKPYINRARGEL